jgi:hypothetical protein
MEDGGTGASKGYEERGRFDFGALFPLNKYTQASGIP